MSVTDKRPHPPRRQRGVTLIELLVVVGMLSVIFAVAMPSMNSWFANQRARTAAREISDLFHFARAEAMRTGNNHIIFFGLFFTTDPAGNLFLWQGSWAPILVINDGPPATSNCVIDAGEIVGGLKLANLQGLSWGVVHANARISTDGGPSAFNPAPPWDGGTFAGPSGGKVNWIMFRPDGVPVTFTGTGSSCGTIGTMGTGGGALYMSNDVRDYGIVLTVLGGVRLYLWNSATSTWTG